MYVRGREMQEGGGGRERERDRKLFCPSDCVCVREREKACERGRNVRER